jgi:hypothetical protein
MMQAAHSSPEKIAYLREAYDSAVAGGWAEMGQLEWLEDEQAVLQRAPHLAGGDIKVVDPCIAYMRTHVDDVSSPRAGRHSGVGKPAGLLHVMRLTLLVVS